MIKLIKLLNLKYLAILFFILILNSGQVYFDIFIPDKIQNVLDLFGTGTPTVASIMISFLYAFLYCLGSFICYWLLVLTASFLTSIYGKNIRAKLFSHISDFSKNEIDKFSIPSLITRNTNDVNKLCQGFNFFLRVGFATPLTIVFGMYKILSDNTEYAVTTSNADLIQYSILISAGITVMCALIVAVLFVLIPNSKKYQKYTDELNKTTREYIAGIRVVRAFNNQNFHVNRFDNSNQKIYKINKIIESFLNIIFPFITAILGIVNVSIYWIGANLIHTGQWSTNDLPLLIKYSLLCTIIFTSFIRFGFLIFFLPAAIVSGKRINEVLDTKNSILNGRKTLLTNLKGNVEFKNVSYARGPSTNPIIDNISFKIGGDQTLAIIGPTGSGKTTIVNLLSRLIVPTTGKILINGININDVILSDLRNTMGIVPQKNFLFNTTIKENIEYGLYDKKNSKNNLEKVMKACKIACANSFIEKCDGKYDHIISQNATNLSGGQKQRLAIARAIIRKPMILVFDDSFSALDLKTDLLVRQNINSEIPNCVKIIVAQKISTIINADKIIVLDKGKKVGEGTHADLLKNNRIYKEIVLSQMTLDELNYANK